jgi:hypothetical protein
VKLNYITSINHGPDSQAGIDPPERAAFPNHRHDAENVIPQMIQ